MKSLILTALMACAAAATLAAQGTANQQRLQVNLKRFAARPDMDDDIEVCAKCVAGMPCSLTSPIPPVALAAS